MTKMRFKTYSELIQLPTFEERFRYLALSGVVGDQTFGWERHLNQSFYNSTDWRRTRDHIIVRDGGCDMAVQGREIYSTIYIHHINPLTPADLRDYSPALLNPENLISVTHQTHNAIHYGDENNLQKDFVERTPGDTVDW